MYTYKPEVGDIVTYNGYTPEQVCWGSNDTPYMLIVGHQYTIDYVESHKYHTKVGIKGVVGRFNSVHFALAVFSSL